MSTLVTGSSGYIAGHLVPALQGDGHEVVGVDRDAAGTAAPGRFVHGDLMDDRVLDRALEGIDTVFHLAAAKDDWGLTAGEYWRDNVEATRELLEAGSRRGVRRWVFFSSVAAMGSGERPRDERSALAPDHPYGRSKAGAEALFREFARDTEAAEVLILRPSVVYGPGNPPSTNVYRLIDAIHRGRFVMVGDGNTIKTTSYIDNLVAATLFAYERLQRGVTTFIYVDEPVLSTGVLVRRIYRLLDIEGPRVTLPRWLAQALGYAGTAMSGITRTDLPITADRIRKFCTSTNFDGGAIRSAGFRQPVDNLSALRRTTRDYMGQA